MRTMLQTKRTVGSRKPYKREEWMRTVDKGAYREVEFPFRIKNEDAYFFFYLLPGEDRAFALAYPFEGFSEFIDWILREDAWEKAFRQEWPRFDNMLITDQKKFWSEIAKRPILMGASDPDDDFKSKWVVASQIMGSAQDSDDVQNAKILRGLESLREPTLGLHIEVTDALNRVESGQIKGRYNLPMNDFRKSGLQKFFENYQKVQPYLEYGMEALKILTGK